MVGYHFSDYKKGGDETAMATQDVTRWTKIRSALGSMWDFVLVAVPLVWTLRANAAMRYSGGIATVFYSPRKRYAETEEQFLENVAWFGARAMDRVLRRKGINQVDIWAMGQIPLEDRSGKRVWKGVRLVLDKTTQRNAGVGSLSNLAAVDPQRYLSLCSLQWVDESELPEWPESEAPYSPV